MHRWLAVLIVTVVSALIISCGSEPQVTVESAFETFREAIREVESPEEKTALCEGFLSQFPISEHTGSLAGAIAYYRGVAMEDPAGAVAVLDTILEGVDDPDTRFEVQLARFPLAQEIGDRCERHWIDRNLQKPTGSNKCINDS